MVKSKSLALFKGYHWPMGAYFSNYSQGGFTQLSLDLTSNCNYNCDWCFNKKIINKKVDSLSLKEKEKILIESIKLGTKTLIFPGAGEPTLDPDFYPLVEIANNLGLITVVYTNLTGNIDFEKIKFLFNKNVSIGIKLDSLNPDYFIKRYHANKPCFDKFLENLNSVLKVYSGAVKKSGKNKVYRIIANMVLTEENKFEIDKISDFCKDNDLPLFVRPVKPVDWAKDNIIEWGKIGNPSGELTPGVDLVKLAKKYNTLFSPSSTIENHCAIYSFGLTIKENGDIQICPDYHESNGKFGNIRKCELKKIIKQLNSNRIIKSGYCVMLPEIKH